MAYSANQVENGAPASRPMSRIESDVESVKSMTKRVERMVSLMVGHARALGYFEPPPATSAIAPTAVITTLSDALRELDRAIDSGSAALNVFD